ncbi:hypothetical protein O4M70_001552 [Staphylococcus pseudintermedius]|uniref:hypothetical protein n=1 Tax=Staphylococcus pseudintermedius TaxID=283734 RepID=UPI0008096C67|nr:hypothetical protein [Staphylococcus pseudintermedius]ANS89927.1 hypothetical protein A6M57_8055 [Staphylococcus pseudintermedius]EGQ0369773.1 hypothetical protein [Staphylococcus pseudintermedius]EGQ2708731.1 hypothetical protein [Staphylococcus pseudintermedius]EGQ2732173.1 hypothetical protein [Staphylococcus pseudintermedius]EGQ3085663.1 hypothetical protein [Staphylococcus pseudintermedius]
MKRYTLKVYCIRTPKYYHYKDIDEKNKRIDNTHFEINIVDQFFYAMQLVEEAYIDVTLSHIEDNCKITFKDYKVLNNQYSIVEFETDKYGSEKPIKDNIENTSENFLKHNESVTETVYLIINRRYGLMYATKDYNTILNKATINTFIDTFRGVLIPYIDEWNKLNEKNNYKIYRRPAIVVDSLPSTKFFDELDTLLNITEFSYSFDPTGSDDVPDFEDLDIMNKNGFSRRDFKETRIFKDLKNKYSIEKIKRLYGSIYNKSNFDDYIVKGTDYNGSNKTVKPEFSMRTEMIFLDNITDININEVINKINDLLEKNNPMKGKIFDLKPIQELSLNYSNESLQNEIKKLADGGKNLKIINKKKVIVKNLIKILNDIKNGSE